MAGSYRISAHTTAALVSMKEQDLASDECPGEQRISDQAVSSILSQGLNAPTLRRPALCRSLKLLIPGKLARGPGANPQTKSETSTGLERLLVGA